MGGWGNIIAIIAWLYVLSLAVLAWLAWSAPDGWQDDDGFHRGQPDDEDRG